MIQIVQIEHQGTFRERSGNILGDLKRLFEGHSLKFFFFKENLLGTFFEGHFV